MGPETHELLQRIAGWRQRKTEARERRELVTALRRAGVPGPDAATGKALKALRWRRVPLAGGIGGTVAYQTYSPMLGLKLPGASLRTGDIILRASRDSSPSTVPRCRLSICCATPTPVLGGTQSDRHTSSFVSATGVRVEFLAPRRRSQDKVWLKTLHTHAQALPYLEYLLHDPARAAVLAGAGVLVQVPDPARYAWHKLVIAPQRRIGLKRARTFSKPRC